MNDAIDRSQPPPPTAPEEPCGNEDECDRCYPLPRWKIRKHRIQHITYTREIKAATQEEAMRLFEEGTPWPTSYDDDYGEIIQQDEAMAEQLPPSEYHLEDCCYHDLDSRRGKRTAMEAMEKEATKWISSGEDL